MMTLTTCPCGSGRAYDECCGPIHAGTVQPATAEALMRARYSAFVVKNIDFLEGTLLPETRADFNREETEQWAGNSEWQGLVIRGTEAGGADDDTGSVEFVASFSYDGKDYRHHETSRFQKLDGRWYYVDGILGQRPRTVDKVGRNDPCPCGSGKKYKKCHGA